jgi:hypothetical protein
MCLAGVPPGASKSLADARLRSRRRAMFNTVQPFVAEMATARMSSDLVSGRHTNMVIVQLSDGR